MSGVLSPEVVPLAWQTCPKAASRFPRTGTVVGLGGGEARVWCRMPSGIQPWRDGHNVPGEMATMFRAGNPCHPPDWQHPPDCCLFSPDSLQGGGVLWSGCLLVVSS